MSLAYIGRLGLHSQLLGKHNHYFDCIGVCIPLDIILIFIDWYIIIQYKGRNVHKELLKKLNKDTDNNRLSGPIVGKKTVKILSPENYLREIAIFKQIDKNVLNVLDGKMKEKLCAINRQRPEKQPQNIIIPKLHNNVPFKSVITYNNLVSYSFKYVA